MRQLSHFHFGLTFYAVTCLLMVNVLFSSATAQTISMSGHQQPHAAGTSAEISVAYEISTAGIVQVQLVDSSWKKIAEAIEKVEPGTGKIILAVELPAATPPAANYRWQALLYNADWKKQAEESVGD